MKIVINDCYGGFGLSEQATNWMTEKMGEFYYGDIERNNPILVQCIEELGSNANDTFSKLKIVKIPDEVKWEINDYDGMETIHEIHRVWG